MLFLQTLKWRNRLSVTCDGIDVKKQYALKICTDKMKFLSRLKVLKKYFSSPHLFPYAPVLNLQLFACDKEYQTDPQ